VAASPVARWMHFQCRAPVTAKTNRLGKNAIKNIGYAQIKVQSRLNYRISPSR
jgi:hypothetical protein